MADAPDLTVVDLRWTREAVLGRAGADGLISANMPGWSVFQLGTYGVRAERSDGSVVARVLPRGLALTHRDLPDDAAYVEGLTARLAAQTATVVVESPDDLPEAP